ncbi:MAG TPA: response regulator [Polyangiales bacterium]
MAHSILVVDDSTMVRRYVRQALEALGYEVREAANGQAALKSVAEQRPALVISDVNMAPMNGFDLVRELRTQLSRTDLPILMLTTEADDEMKARGKQLGASGWLVKPFDPVRMGAVVQHLLNARSDAKGTR